MCVWSGDGSHVGLNTRHLLNQSHHKTQWTNAASSTTTTKTKNKLVKNWSVVCSVVYTHVSMQVLHAHISLVGGFLQHSEGTMYSKLCLPHPQDLILQSNHWFFSNTISPAYVTKPVLPNRDTAVKNRTSINILPSPSLSLHCIHYLWAFWTWTKLLLNLLIHWFTRDQRACRVE